jgi:hypothetical protein
MMFEWLSARIEQAKETLKEFSLEGEFLLNPPATETDIQACEAALGNSLPASYREFLLHCNGATLCYEMSECDRPDQTSLIHDWSNRCASGLIIHGTNDLIKFSQEKKDQISHFQDFEKCSSMVFFCSLIGSDLSDWIRSLCF